jgi:hypothetical protein
MGSTRKIADGPFCWQSKEVLRFIRDCFDATNNIASALAVYVSLTEKASDEQSETFNSRIRDIAARAGVSYKTATSVLHRFEKLRIIAILRNKIENTQENAPSTYTLLGLGNDCPTLGNDQEPGLLPRKIEESLRTHSDKRSTHHSNEWRFCYSREELEIIDLYNQICVPRGWRSVNTYSEEYRRRWKHFLIPILKTFSPCSRQPRTRETQATRLTTTGSATN